MTVRRGKRSAARRGQKSTQCGILPGTKRPPRIFQLVRTLELERIVMTGDDLGDYTFRIEVLRECPRRNHYYARVWRLESLRVRPTFPMKKRESSDKEILVIDVAVAPNDSPAKTEHQVVERVLTKIHEMFRLPLGQRKLMS